MKSQCQALVRRYVALVGVVVFFLPLAVFGQVTTAGVTGVVSDQQGAVIPDVKVSVKNVGTGTTREVQTDARGGYVVSLLPVGSYTVTAEKQGFKTVTIPDVTLAAGDNLRENLELQVGALTQTVEVTGAPPALQTENASLGSLINPVATQELPLNGRNVQGLAILIAGANQGQTNAMASGNRPDDRRPTSAVSINGQSQQYNDFLLDGTDNNERYIGTLVVKPQIDALAEVKIDTDNYSAAASRTAGGVINFVTKSGTDQFHGSIYEFLRNTNLDARNFFDKTNRLPYHQNQYGGSVGGPIVKGKAFFFGDYEGLRVRQGLSYVNTIPTAAMKQGNFGAVPNVQPDIPIFNPFTNVTSGGVTTRTRFPNDVIPAASACTGPGMGCLDPIISQVVNFYPATNAAGLASNNFEGETKLLNIYTFDGRIDDTINSKNTFFGRYSFNNSYSILPGTMPLVSYGSISGIQPGGGNGTQYYGTAPERAMNQTLGWTRVFSPNFVMDVRAAYSRFHVNTLPPNYGKNIDLALGIPNGNTGDILSSGLTLMAISGYAYLGEQGAIPLNTIDNGWEGLANFNWQHSSHNIKFGGRFERRLNENLQGASTRGVFTFDGNFTNDPTKTVAGSGNAIASFLLGVPSATSRADSLVVWGPQMIEAGLYVQDDWQVTKSLTLNLGVRWDYFPYMSDKYNRLTNIDFNVSPAKFFFPNTMGFNSHAGVDTGNHDFGPRVGFAKRFGQNSVLRGGFGVSFDPYSMGSTDTLRNAPWVALYTVTQNTIATGNIVDAGFPLPVPLDPNNPIGTSRPIAFNFPNSYAEQWNLTAERNVSGFVFRLAYVGVSVRHAWTQPDINQPAPGLGAVNPRRPFYSLWMNSGPIVLSENGSTANYHALQFTVERRYKNGFSLLANYSYSRALDDGAYFGSGSPDSEGNSPPEYTGRLAEEYGLSDYNCSHRGVISGNYQLPWGKSLTGYQGVLGRGWQINGILTLQSGFPFTAVNAANTAGTGDADRPNQVGAWQLSNPTVQKFFNTAAFATQAAGTLGSVGRDTMIGPTYKTMDFSVFKNFKLNERFGLQFRTECFNLPNHANFNLPGNLIGSSAAGVIPDTGNNLPRVIQFALKLSF